MSNAIRCSSWTLSYTLGPSVNSNFKCPTYKGAVSGPNSIVFFFAVGTNAVWLPYIRSAEQFADETAVPCSNLSDIIVLDSGNSFVTITPSSIPTPISSFVTVFAVKAMSSALPWCNAIKIFFSSTFANVSNVYSSVSALVVDPPPEYNSEMLGIL